MFDNALACDDKQRQVKSLWPISTIRRTPFRLAWEARDPLPCPVALGEVLRRYRVPCRRSRSHPSHYAIGHAAMTTAH
jgi:hypothetical protein